MLNAGVGSARVTTPGIQRSTWPYAGLFLGAALAWTWPLATRLAWRIPHDPGDPLLNTWILWWNAQALPFTTAWWNAPIFHPMPGALALSEHLAGIALFTVPLHAAGLTPLAAYNVALILSAWLSAFFAFLLGRRLTGSAAAGVIAGLAFGFAPYRASQLSHLQVLTAQWMPLALFAMHAYLEEGGRRLLLLFACAWLLLALSNGYYLLFFPVLLALWLPWFVRWRTDWRRGLALAGAFVAASLPLLPLLLRYRAVHDALGLRRTVEEMVRFSGSAASFLHPARLLAFWPTGGSETQEGFLFPGVTVVLLALAGGIGMVRGGALRRAVAARSAAVFYASAAALLWWLSLGPAEQTADALFRPYTLLARLPGFGGLRAPARFAMVATLCISVAAAIAWTRIVPSRGIARAAALALALVGLFVDGWIETMPLAPAPARVRIEAPPDAVVVELPTDDPATNVAAMYRAIAHRRPLVNGYSGHTPPHYDLLSISLRRGDPSALAYFARGGTVVALVHRTRDLDGAWRALVRAAGGELQEESGLGPVFVITPKPRERRPAAGPPLPSAPLDRDGDGIGIDVGSEQVIRAVRLPLRHRYAELAPRMRVEVSTDGRAWTVAWDDWTGEAAVAAALADQRVVPLTIQLPDVRARYVRVRPAPAWLVREMRALGPG